MGRAGQWLIAMLLGAGVATTCFLAGAAWRGALPLAPLAQAPSGPAAAAPRTVTPRGDLGRGSP